MNKVETAFYASEIARPPQRQISRGARVSEFDGARGLAVLAVVIAHYFGEVEHGFTTLRILGPIGVNLFFVLSGFLIGSIILERVDSQNFFRVFYARRALRILPVYFLVVATTLTLIWLLNVPWAASTLPAWSYFTFTQNFFMAVRGDVGTRWLTPTWTLAVEEQFYLLIPLLIFLLPAKAILPSIRIGIALCFLIRVILCVRGDGISAECLLFSSGHILLIGVLAAYAQKNIKPREITMRVIALVSVAALLLVEANAEMVGEKLFLISAPVFMAALFASCILLAANRSPGLRFLGARFLTSFGTISYCLYLIHQPISGLMHGLILGTRPDIATTPQILVTCAAAVVSISTATASWFALEKPLLQFGRRKSY